VGIRRSAVAHMVQGGVAPCRLCGATLRHSLVDLGSTPLANTLVTPAEAAEGPDAVWPLHVRVCESCLLVQVDRIVPPETIFRDYPYFSSVSSSWVAHARRCAQAMIARLGLGAQSLVLEVASNDGYLLQHFVARGIPVLGIEPAANVAAAAQGRGVRTEVAFFSLPFARSLAARGIRADLLIANNVLAHVPDITGFVAGIAEVLTPRGVALFEFPHLLRLLEGMQFDTIYHEHYSYLSLLVVEHLLARAGLRAFDAMELPTHGGSLRVLACRTAADFTETAGLDALRAQERAARLDAPAGYEGFADRVAAVQAGLRAFLAARRASGRRVAAYGAAAKGCTLLNTSGVTAADILCVADRSPAKQGRLLPGCRVPIVAPAALRRDPPDDLLILPWNLADEIAAELHDLHAAGTRFWVAVPAMREISAPPTTTV
jgi:SAM-dependent methyltransferase